MRYVVTYSNEARMDLRGIYEYLAFERSEQEIAKRQTARIIRAIESLDEMPLRHRLCEDEKWGSKGLRVLKVDNYLVFYLVIEEKTAVAVVRIMHQSRDFKKQLDIVQKHDIGWVNENHFEYSPSD